MGKIYTSDIIIYPDKINGNWWRKTGHLLQKEDLKDILNHKPEILIIGTGRYGVMKVPEETRNFIKSKKIKIIIEKTKKACEIYNELKDKKKVIAAFHLTC